MGSLGANAGTYTLTACLDIPGTMVMDHCSNTSYLILNGQYTMSSLLLTTPIPPAVPGKVNSLACPTSNDGEVLRIRWGDPSDNAASVTDYQVTILEYYQPEDSSMVETRPLTPPFEQEVQYQWITVTAGVSE